MLLFNNNLYVLSVAWNVLQTTVKLEDFTKFIFSFWRYNSLGLCHNLLTSDVTFIKTNLKKQKFEKLTHYALKV